MPKKEKVREMFDNIAPSYDKLNHVLSMNVDKLWRRHALKEIVDGTYSLREAHTRMLSPDMWA